MMLPLLLLGLLISAGSAQALYPTGMSTEFQADFNGMTSFLSEAGRFNFIISGRTASAYATALYGKGFIEFFKLNEFKALVEIAIEYTYDSFKLNNQLPSNPVSSTNFVNSVADNTKLKIDEFMVQNLQQPQIDQAQAVNISYNKLVYFLLSVRDIFVSNPAVARKAYEDVFSANKDLVVNTSAINSPAMLNWIASIRERFAQLNLPASTPVVSSISPSSGSESGGTSVVVAGSGFTGATNVKFGTTEVSFRVDSDFRITTTSPSGTGAVDVTVTTPTGGSANSPADDFTYTSLPPPIPLVSRLTPNFGQEEGGTSVLVQGSGFASATAVLFGPNPALSFKVLDNAQISAVSPPGKGTVEIIVVESGVDRGRAELVRRNNLFMYGLPGVE